jgi:hypothetical protein
MLGHKLWRIAGDRLETWATVRQVTPAMKPPGWAADRTIEGIDVRQPSRIDAAFGARDRRRRQLRRHHQAAGSGQGPRRVDSHQRAAPHTCWRVRAAAASG